MDHFEHDSLEDGNKIRIAYLEPGAFHDVIEITLEQASLHDETVGFEALSYVWGDPSEKYQILCNNKSFHVTKNLYRALKFLRKERQSRALWIDAICIHQDNISERNQQVGHMKFIYSQAKKVVIWVGENVEDARAGYEMCQLTLSIRRAYPNLSTLDPPGRRRLRDSLYQQKTFINTRRNALKFLENEWFRRVWTFQEVYLSREAEVQCGQYTYPWILFSFAWHILDTIGIRDYTEAHNSAITVIATYQWHKEMEFEGVRPEEQTIRLSNLVRSTRTHMASDPRDKLFGLLAMVEPRNGVEYVADYNMTVEEAYIRFARLMLQDDGHLQILSDASGATSNNSTFPSWVPYWTKVVAQQKFEERIRNFPLKYNLHKGFQTQLSIPEGTDPRRLQLNGSFIDRIAEFVQLEPLVDQIDRANGFPETYKSLLTSPKAFLDQLDFLPETYSRTEETLLSAAIRTLAADDLPTSTRGTESTIKESFPWYHDLRNATWEEAIFPEASSLEAISASTRQYFKGAPVKEVYDALFARGTFTVWPLGVDRWRSYIEDIYCTLSSEILKKISMMIRTRAFFTTEKGYIGIGPRNIERGDMIYDLIGGDVPFILRPDENPGEFKFVGDAYVHGIMDGELWKVSADSKGLESVHGDLTWSDIVLV
ncbi:heterokaryon incompatibility protein-domain-containing protein [Xylogone sp. PMI_703]|nr:heterokaryon incompatibility protein-domain-containing protein [Xylogone sp. PMI_703]